MLWVSKSQRRLSAALAERGFTAGQKLVGRLLRRLGFSLQANSKTREGVSHPDRNAQFEHINAEVKAFQAAGEPAISVDTKKKELVGDFKNSGRELRPKGRPEPVRVRDFEIPELGKAVPYGIYDIADNAGWVNLGISHDTAGSNRAVAPVAGTASLADTRQIASAIPPAITHWRGKPRQPTSVIIQLIANTTTDTGLTVPAGSTTIQIV